MKTKITFSQLKKLVTEESSITEPKVSYEEFKEWFVETVYSDDLLRDEWRDIAVMWARKSGLSDNWGGYEDSGEKLFVLNVKYKGQGDWDKFNKDGRAEKIGFDTQDYWEMLQSNIRAFYEDWDNRFRSDFKLDLYAAGRSNGYWGVKAEFLKSEEPTMLIVDDSMLRPLYEQKIKVVEFDPDGSPDDWVYDLVEDALFTMKNSDNSWVDPSQVASYFMFSPKFAQVCKEFEDSVDRQSAEYATQEFNDQEFANIAEDEFEVNA